MRMFRTDSGPFAERPFYEDTEIESIATDELREVGLFPTAPGPIRVDRFIERRFGVVPEYDDLPPGILGLTRFGLKGPEAVVVLRSLSEEGSKVAERRINSTLAHEGGHMLLHGHLFSLRRRAGTRPLFREDLDERKQEILCRSDTVEVSPEPASTRHYDGRWWEYQANRMIGALLIPRQLVREAIGPDLFRESRLGAGPLDDTRREEAVRRLANVFEVNPAVARIRIDQIFPNTANVQLTF